MTLPKHLRPRYRYIAIGIETWPDAEIDRRTLQTALWTAARSLIGDAGSATIDLTVQRFQFTNGDGAAIIRTCRGTESTARAAIACLTELDGQPVGVRVKGLSGTVRACEEKYL